MAYSNVTHRRRIAAGLCRNCAMPRNLYANLCDQCRERERERDRERDRERERENRSEQRRNGASPRVQRGLATHAEIGKLLGITRARVWQLEQSALAKIAAHPVIRQLAVDYGLIPEDAA